MDALSPLPQLVKYASRFQLVIGLQQGYKLVELGQGEVGLYLSQFTNDFQTPLAVRGPRAAVEALLDEILAPD